MKIKIILFVIIIILIVTLLFVYYYTNQDTTEEFEQKLLLFKQNVRDDLKKFNMIKRIKDNRGLLEPKTNFTKIERLSYYQTFVTPNHKAIIDYIQSHGLLNYEDAYTIAVSWTWISDITLHGVNEKWLKPVNFILDTPNKTKYPNNPIDGMVSDCESQAYTLVSILETLGIPKENIRVCIGLVDFGSGSGGHAWVQIYSNNKWYELEATSGPYWDDDTNQLIDSPGLSMEYFQTRPYPVEEYWVFFNDIYYYNPDTGIKSTNLPNNWLTTEKQFTINELRSIIKNKSPYT